LKAGEGNPQAREEEGKLGLLGLECNDLGQMLDQVVKDYPACKDIIIIICL